MKEYQVLLTKNESRVNQLLNDGWCVDSVTPQYVSNGGGSHFQLEGSFFIVLSRLKE
jgi:hypothetical protein